MGNVIELSAEGILVAAEQFLEARDLDAALRCFYDAEAEGADANRCAAGRWLVHMLRGKYPAAWAESRAIRACGVADPNCLWKGEEIAGKRVIVRCLHGFGDAIQFFRYAPQLRELAANVVWEVPPELLQLARCFPGVEHVITWDRENSTAPEWDVQIEIMELPCIFRTRLSDLPIAMNYLRIPVKLVSSVRAEMGFAAAPRIGLVWAAGEWNPSRSVPLELLSPILETDGCEFWNLQGGPARRCAREIPNYIRLRDAKPCHSGITPLAAVISQLDLVITVDTLAAHLAGALGVEAWVMLQYAADWRWMVGRSDSPWYPSLRLFRQPSPGDWPSVLKAVQCALDQWMTPESGRIAA